MKEKIIKAINHDMYGKFFCNHVAALLVKPVVALGVNANQVTIFYFFLGLLAVGFYAEGSRQFALYGAVLLLITPILDGLDGMIARYNGKPSKYGEYLEYIYHEVIPPAIFLGLGIHSFKVTGSVLNIYIGSITAIAIFFINISRSSKERIALYVMQKTGKVFPYVPHKIRYKKGKSIKHKVVAIALDVFFPPGHMHFFIFVATVFNQIVLLLLFYGIMYLLIAIVKGYMEIKSGVSEYGLV